MFGLIRGVVQGKGWQQSGSFRNPANVRVKNKPSMGVITKTSIIKIHVTLSILVAVTRRNMKMEQTGLFYHLTLLSRSKTRIKITVKELRRSPIAIRVVGHLWTISRNVATSYVRKSMIKVPEFKRTVKKLSHIVTKFKE